MPNIHPSTYQHPVFPFYRNADMDAAEPARHPVVIVGAGPTGLTLALDLANHGIPSVLISRDNTVSTGSRAICFSKKTLEIINRISPRAAERMLTKGVIWNVGKVFYKNEQVYEFNLLPEKGHKMPAFINLQQYYFEEYLIDEVKANPLIDLRWQNELTGVTPMENKVLLEVSTPEGGYRIEAEYLLACDGVHSLIRQSLGIPFEGESFEETFLISDITMEKDFPSERWFWFDPPFNPGQSALLHKQPDGVWRIDMQLGYHVDKERELDPARIRNRLQKMLGPAVNFELEWTSIYHFRCMRIPVFVQGRVIFAGDSAHLVSPFGARGANGAIQDVDNLGWKLAAVLKGQLPESLLQTYQEERSPAADENIRHSTRATDFITPKSSISRTFRNAALELAAVLDSIKPFINSGRLSHACKYLNTSLIQPDDAAFQGPLQPGCTAPDVPLLLQQQQKWLLEETGNRFVLLYYTNGASARLPDLSFRNEKMPVDTLIISSDPAGRDGYVDVQQLFAQRYDAVEGTWYLIRPDHYLAARGRHFDRATVHRALQIAMGLQPRTDFIPVVDQAPAYPGDDRYNQLIRAHEGMSTDESAALNAKLVLLFMEQCKDNEEWDRLLEIASNSESPL